MPLRRSRKRKRTTRLSAVKKTNYKGSYDNGWKFNQLGVAIPKFHDMMETVDSTGIAHSTSVAVIPPPTGGSAAPNTRLQEDVMLTRVQMVTHFKPYTQGGVSTNLHTQPYFWVLAVDKQPGAAIASYSDIMGRSDAGTAIGPFPNMNNRNRFVIIAKGIRIIDMDLSGTKTVAKPFQLTLDKSVKIPQHYLGATVGGARADIATNELVWATATDWNENVARVDTYFRIHFKDTL